MFSSSSFDPAPPSHAHDEDAEGVPEAPSVPFTVRAGSAVGLAALAACVGVIPATLRMAPLLGGAGGVLKTWVALVAAVLVPMVLVVAVLRGMWAGLRTLGGEGGAARLFGFVVWAAFFFTGLVAFGTVLRATTHHHALAGATFAVIGVVVGGVLAVFAGRLVQILAPVSRVLRVFNGVVGTVFLLVLGLVVARISAPSASGGMPLDLLACGVAALVASHPMFASRRAVAFASFPLAGPLFILGLAVLRSSAAPYDVVAERAPAFAPVVRVLAGR